jgi:hypothetical protein
MTYQQFFATCFIYTLGFCGSSYAQESTFGSGLRLEPLGENPQLRQYWQGREETHNSQQNTQFRNFRTCPVTVQSLPFFDDFARLDSLFPACSHWQDYQAVVGAGLADAPPTVGAVSLDGLNQYGQPYNQLSNPNLSYSADTLTSQPIDLSSYDTLDGLVFSYYYQAQGLGDRPEVMDSLFLEFKNAQGAWKIIRSYGGISSAQLSIYRTPAFVQELIAMRDTAFIHADFQFRFRNTGSITGNNDHWHLDYIYLDANRTGTTTSADVAFNRLPSSPLGKYTAVPWAHFLQTMWADTIALRMQNLGTLSGTLNRRYEVFEPNTATTLISTPLPALTYAPSPNANDSLRTNFLGTFANFTPTDTTTLLSVYSILNPTDFQNNPLFANSDTVRLYTPLNNYFAYDDGTAESRIIAEHIGTQVAVEFRTTVEDTLRGIYFHLPYFTNRNASQDFVNVKVWFSSLNNEVFSRDIYRLQYSSDFNGLHYVALADFAGELTPLYIPANTVFYVGWQQSSTISVPVGFDKNNDASDKTFVYTGNAWAQSTLKGAVMLRPVLSISPDFQIIPVERVAPNTTKKELVFELFPNPVAAGGDVYLRLSADFLETITTNSRPDLVRIYDVSGRLLAWQAVEKTADLSALRLNLPTLAAGVYTVQLSTKGQPLGAKSFQLYK